MKKKSQKVEKIGISIPPDLLETLRGEAEKEGRPLSNLITFVLREHYESKACGAENEKQGLPLNHSGRVRGELAICR